MKTLRLPKLAPVLLEYPDVKLEFDINYGFRDIVADRFDAGVRFGDTVHKDMVAMPIGPVVRMAAVASPAYLSNYPIHKKPQDLVKHRCIDIRFPTRGGLDAWEYERRGRTENVRVDGPLIFNTTPHITSAALAGLGIAYLPEDGFSPHLESGELIRVLENSCPAFPGYHLYYPSCRLPSPAFGLVLEALRLR